MKICFNTSKFSNAVARALESSGGGGGGGRGTGSIESMLRVTVVRWCVDATLAFLRGGFFGVEWRLGFRGAPAVDENDVGVDTAAAAATINDDDDDDIVVIVYMRLGMVRN